MPPRTNLIHTPGRAPVPTPAPLLLTRRGQLPHIPPELLPLALPPSHPPLLLQLPLFDWHMLNPNVPLHGADLFRKLRERAAMLPEPPSSQAYSTGAAGYCNLPDAVLFLCPRAAGSAQLVTDTPGKSLNVSATGASRRDTASPADVARLHAALRTHFVTSPSDAAVLPCGRLGALRRRAERAEKQVDALVREGAKGVLVSVGGGDHMEMRRQCAETAKGRVEGGAVVGYSIDGLYAGEGPEVRWRCVEEVIGGVGEEGVRVLGGGSGGPWEVVEAVGRGVDVVESGWALEMAAAGMATDLGRGGLVNCRERRWMVWKGALVDGCECGVCRDGVSRGYVRHLLEVHEMMGVTMIGVHNVYDYLKWWGEVRGAVQSGAWTRFAKEFERKRAMVRHEAMPGGI